MPTTTIADHISQAADETQQRNLDTVQQIYACFGQGDLPGILEKLSESVEWWHAGDSGIVKYAGTYKGKDGVLQFFQHLSTSTEFTGFEVFNFRAYNNRVVCDGKVSCIARPTGKAYNVKPQYTWTIDANGKVSSCHIDGDMSEAEAAFSD